ncbi:uncharacterized protein WM294_012217 [Sarcoramphus papa]
MAPASRSCTRGRPGRGRAAPGTGSCRRASCWAGSSAGRGVPATSTSRAASPPSAGPCRSTSLSLGLAAWPCWASRSSPCSLPFACTTTLTRAGRSAAETSRGLWKQAAGKDTPFPHTSEQSSVAQHSDCFPRQAGALPSPVSAPAGA